MQARRHSEENGLRATPRFREDFLLPHQPLFKGASSCPFLRPRSAHRKPKQLSVSPHLLAGATKKGKASNHLVYTGEAGQEAAARWLDLNAKFAETERELGLARDQVLDVIRPWHEETCARRKAHEATVVVETPTGALRVSFQHRYTKLALDREEHLRQVLGDDFERYFKRTVSLKVKKEVAEDPERLERWSSPWPRRWVRRTSPRCSRSSSR